MSRRLEPLMDGAAVLTRLAGERGLRQLLAENTVFLDPKTVDQTEGEPLFHVVRDNVSRRGERTRVDGVDVICCDNDTPTRAFLWSARRTRGEDMQFNHIWTAARDPHTYTALWNICATPTFLAQLTDGSRRPETVSILQYRAFDLYRHHHGEVPPTKPDGYDELRWHPMPDPVDDLEAELRRRLHNSPRSRAARSARLIGWKFNNWDPDPTVGVDLSGDGT